MVVGWGKGYWVKSSKTVVFEGRIVHTGLSGR